MTRARHVLPWVLVLGLALRVWGLGFGLPAANARPDETQIAGSAVGFLSGDLTPPFFQWPMLFAYFVSVVYVGYFAITKPFGGYATLAAFAESRRQSLAPFLYISRTLSMLAGVLTLWWVYRLGRRAFSETVGVVAALFLAVSVLHARDSHFGVTDVPMTGLCVLAVLLILRWQQSGRLRWALAGGVVTGLAGATKYNGLGVGVAFLVAAIQRVNESAPEREGESTGAAAGILVYSVATVGAFFGASPYILIEWQRFVADTNTLRSTFDVGHGLSLGRGWWYYASTVLPAAVGWPVFLAGVAGAALLLATRLRESAVVLAFPIAYYAFAGRGFAVFARYMLPVVPFLCLSAAWTVVTTTRWLARAWPRHARDGLTAIVTLALAMPAATSTVQLDRLLATTDNRVATARALVDAIPAGSSFYQSGEGYGHVPLSIDGREVAVRQVTFDLALQRFDPGNPDFVLVQRSPLVLYSVVPTGLNALLGARYRLVRSFETGAQRVERLYDQQDAFYFPLANFAGLARPGPSFDLYARSP